MLIYFPAIFSCFLTIESKDRKSIEHIHTHTYIYFHVTEGISLECSWNDPKNMKSRFCWWTYYRADCISLWLWALNSCMPLSIIIGTSLTLMDFILRLAFYHTLEDVQQIKIQGQSTLAWILSKICWLICLEHPQEYVCRIEYLLKGISEPKWTI